MKIYNCNENKYHWFDKVNWKRVIFIFIILFVLFFSFFYFVISSKNDIERAISTSLLISYAISIGIIVYHSIDNRINFYIIKDEKLYVIMPHQYSHEYNDSLISYSDFRKMVDSDKKINDILANQSKYVGIDIFLVDSIKNIKIDNKGFKFTASGNFSKWKSTDGIFVANNYFCESVESNKKFYVTFDYNKYEELLSFIKSFK